MANEQADRMEAILNQVVEHREGVRKLQDILLANLVMVGEIPAETGKEQKRVRFVLDRFRECSLDKISTDEADNALAVLPGSGEGEGSILVCAHLDTHFDATVDHTVRVDTSTVAGAGIADNSLGVAVLCSLPTVLQELGIQLESDVVFMGASRGLGRGDLHGINFFLDHHPGPLKAGVCVEGVDLGRLSYQSIGMLRGEIVCRVAAESDRGSQVSSGAIEPLVEVVRLIEEIPLPARPRTTINLGSLRAGATFHKTALRGSLKFEIRSSQVGMVATLQEKLNEIVKRVALESGDSLELEIIARRRNGGIDFEHPLTVGTRKVMDALDIVPEVRPSVGELSSLILKSIPGVTLGITERVESDESEEAIRIEPMFSGIAQLVAMLQAIDGGLCHGESE